MSDDQVASICVTVIGLVVIYFIYKLVDKTL